MITGGQRSGKSLFGEKMALSKSASPYYLATARILDEETALRVERHRARRGCQWINLEAPLFTDRVEVAPDATLLLDCITMLVTNWFFECDEDAGQALTHITESLDGLLNRCADLIVVTCETGLGGISSNTLQRRFTDLLGDVNQWLASRADDVFLMVSGIPVKIK